MLWHKNICLQYSTFRHWLKYKEQSVPISQEQSEKNASSANLSVCKVTHQHLYCAKATWSCIISVEALILKASSLKDFSLCWLSLMTAEVTILLTKRKLWTLTRPECKNSLKIMYRTLWVNPWQLCIHITMAQYGFHFSTGIFGTDATFILNQKKSHRFNTTLLTMPNECHIILCPEDLLNFLFKT